MKAREPSWYDEDVQEFWSGRVCPPQRLAVSRAGMVATQHYLATEAGVRILEAGGNAVDAAVAAAFALGVCEPAASGLGGQTMMLIHLAPKRRTFALDGSSRAPNRTSKEVLSSESRLRGYKATTVPSTPAVLDYSLKRYGSMRLDQVLTPAIEYAKNGYVISDLQHKLFRRVSAHLKRYSTVGLFLKNGKRLYRVGEHFRQPILAVTLERLAEFGIHDFYRGRIAQMIHKDMEQNDGLLREDDLAQIPLPIERRPITCHFEGMRIFTFPPPGAGRTLIEMFNIISQFPRKLRKFDTPRGALLLANVIQQAFRDRRDRPFDPNFYAQVTKRKMLSPDYAKTVAHTIRRQIRTQGETTHLSVMDKQGNVVALTQSIERIFGSCVATAELGFLYNNYMTAFEDENNRHPYYLRPNAVPWASVAPTIIFKGPTPWLAIGSPGSERIVSSIFQVILRLNDQTAYAAVDAPRLHCSFDGVVSLESSRMRDDIPLILEKKGFQIKPRDAYSFYLGCVQMVMHENDTFIGVADPRRDGSAMGPK
ncbi:MAG: gamma-glutamyltransferase [Sedimentisphaerales bacterium]|nr:gamma-glutamyltransferase [Sedimentisphaerales bacterium]